MLRPDCRLEPPPRPPDPSISVFSRDVEGQDRAFFDDDGVPRPPLPPEDRLWRHPSEVHAIADSVAVNAHRTRPIWTAALVLVLSGAALYLAVQIRTGPGSGSTTAISDVVATLMSAPASVTTDPEVLPADAVVMAQKITPPTPSVMVGTTWRPAIVMGDGYLVVAEPEGVEDGDLVIFGPDGTNIEARSVTRAHQVGIAVIATDSDLTPSDYTLGVPPAVGEMVTAEGRTGVVVAQRSEPRADGLLFEAAAIIKIDEVAVGDLVWQGELFVGLVVAVHDHYATVMPASLVMSAASSLINHRELAWIGLAVQQSPGGLVVTDIDVDGPADAAGMRAGDVLTSIDGHELTGADDVLVWLWQCGANTDAVVSIERDGVATDVIVRLAPVPAYA
jgi:S1-C subfamily serine protease